MCEHCNYPEMIESIGLKPTFLRQLVLKSIGDEERPLSATEIMQTVQSKTTVNKVTIYRILDLLVKRGLVRRFSAGDRAFRYGLKGTRHHPNHPHFLCARCGIIECLSPESIIKDLKKFKPKSMGLVKTVEIRFDGVCKNCLKAGS